MDYTVETTEEKNNKRKGIITSFILHILLLVLALLPLLTFPDPPPGQPGVLVALGAPDAGMDDEPASASSEASSSDAEPVEEEVIEEVEEVKEKPKETPTPPQKPKETKKPVTPKKNVLTDKASKELALKKKKERERQEKINDAKRKEEARIKAEKDAAAAKAKAAAAAAAKAKAAAEAEAARKKAEADKWRKIGAGAGSGTGGNPGNQGQPTGSEAGSALDGISTGSGDIGGGLLGRKKISSPKITNNSQKTGDVVVKVCVDASGKVISAKFTQSGSTTNDAGLKRDAIAGAKKYRFSPGDQDKQCGTIKIKFRLK